MQAWGFASGVRKLLGKSPSMSMKSFDKSVWMLHRKLHHRFLRYQQCFVDATEQLEEYQEAEQVASRPAASKSDAPKQQVICLLSSDTSSGTESES